MNDMYKLKMWNSFFGFFFLYSTVLKAKYLQVKEKTVRLKKEIRKVKMTN